MVDIFINNAPKELAGIHFYGTAALLFVLLFTLLILYSFTLGGKYISPSILAIVHTAALGWGTMVIFGAAYQLLPVICERELYSTPLAVLSYILLTIGTCGMIWSFWWFDMGWLMIVSGSCVVGSSYLY